MTDKNRWAIMDDIGIIFEDNYTHILYIWHNPDEYLKNLEVIGDLRLIEIHKMRA